MENQTPAAGGSHSPCQDPADFSNNVGPSMGSEPTTRKRRRCMGIDVIDGNLIVIKTNGQGKPYFPKENVDAFGTRLGYIVRRDIPICYGDWRKVPLGYKKSAVAAIGLQFIFEDEGTIDTDHTWGKLNDYWRSYKCELYNEYVKDQDPILVKQHAPDGLPLEDWRKFVDMCNTDEFKAKSKKNAHNRSLQKMPSCIGRKSAAVLCNEMAVEKGVPYSAIGRPEAYIRMHTKSDKTPQNKDLEDEIIKYLSEHPESRKTGIHDAVAEVVRRDRGGRMLVLGTGVSKTSYRKMEPLLKKNEGLMESKVFYENKIKELEATMATNAAKTKAEMEELRSLLRDQGRTYINDYSPPHRSSSNSGNASRPINSYGHDAGRDQVHGHSNPRVRACGRNAQPDHAYGYTSEPERAYGEDSHSEHASQRASQPDHAYGHVVQPEYAYEHRTQRKRVFGPVIQVDHTYGPSPPGERVYGQGTRRGYATTQHERPYGQDTPEYAYGQRPRVDGEFTHPGQAYDSVTETERAYAFLTRPRHASSVVDDSIGKECELLLSGRSQRAVAKGFVMDVDPNTVFADRKLGDGNFKVYVDIVYEPNTRLPFPHDGWSKTLEDVVPGPVIWSKNFLKFSSSSMT